MRQMTMVAAVLLMAGSALAQPPLILREGTDIRVATRDDISSRHVREGDAVAMIVAEPVVVDGVTVIAAGTPAIGEVTNRRGNGLLGRSGKLEISVREIETDGRSVPVRGSRDSRGTSGAPGVVGAAILFLPLGLLVHGQEAKIRAGTTVDVYVDHDVPVVMAEGGSPPEQPMIAPPPGR